MTKKEVFVPVTIAVPEAADVETIVATLNQKMHLSLMAMTQRVNIQKMLEYIAHIFVAMIGCKYDNADGRSRMLEVLDINLPDGECGFDFELDSEVVYQKRDGSCGHLSVWLVLDDANREDIAEVRFSVRNAEKTSDTQYFYITGVEYLDTYGAGMLTQQEIFNQEWAASL